MLRADPSLRRPSYRTTRDVWIDHGIVALALAVLLVGFNSVIEGRDWWVTTVLVATLTGLTCAVVRSVGRARWAAPAALVVEFVALCWIFVPDTLLLIVPTPATFGSLGDLAVAARRIIIEEQAPVAAAKPVVLVVASAFGLLVVVADLLLERRRTAPAIGVLFLAVFCTPALISGTTPAWWLFILVAALWLAILRSRTTLRGPTSWGRRVPALILASVALAASIAFPAVSPDFSAVATSWGKPPPAVFGRGINPMLELGQNLRRNSPVVALTYTTSLDDPPYLKVATLRDFTGKTWRPATTRTLSRFEGEVGLGRGIEVERASTTITIKQLRSSLLPVPYPARPQVTGLEGSWRWERVGMTLRSDDSDSRGQRYSVESLDIRPTAEQMRGLTTSIGPTLTDYVTLPEEMPDVIADTAREVAADATNDYDKAIALQDYLRSGDFSYSETAPVADDYDGNGVAVIAEFLKRKAGYCVHFSSSMAVMARTLGIPSRIAVGYAPGSATGLVRGQNVYEVSSDDLHAWTELYFDGVGWTRFDPTPSIGTPTTFDEPDAPVTTPESGEVPGSQGQAAPESDATTETATDTTTATDQTGPRTLLVTLAGTALVVLIPGLVRLLRRRWRWRGGTRSPDPLWRELEDTARDHGVVTSAADTPRGFAARLHDRPGIDREALDRLLVRVETTRFARATAGAGNGVGDAQAVAASIRDGSTRGTRWRAALLPRSLAGRPSVTVADGPVPAVT